MDAVKRYRWPNLVKAREGSATATSGEVFMYLAKDVGELFFLRNGKLGTEIVHQAVESFFRRQSLTVNTSGEIFTYTDAGEDGKKAEISTAEKLSVSSSSASADNAKTVTIHGVVSGEELFETVTLPGAGGVDSTNTYSDVYAISIDGSQSGVITIVGKDSATEYATISPGDRTAKYRKVRLSMKPQAADSIVYYFKKRVPTLENDNQVPEIPAASAIVEMAVAKSYVQQRHIAAYQMKMQDAEASLQRAFDASRQSEALLQATPALSSLSRRRGYHGRNYVVVNNGG